MEKTIADLYENTDLTVYQIADKIQSTYKVVYSRIRKLYGSDYRKPRHSRLVGISKAGVLNHMYGKFGSDHHNYIGEVSDGRGYLMILKPEWYTGRRNSKHVFAHTLVICEALGLTELPKGWVIHHIDRVKTNNALNNLALLTNGAHTRLHQLESATTSRKA